MIEIEATVIESVDVIEVSLVKAIPGLCQTFGHEAYGRPIEQCDVPSCIVLGVLQK